MPESIFLLRLYYGVILILCINDQMEQFSCFSGR